MKPKTKFQKKAMKLSEDLPRPTGEQTRWAEQNLFGGHYVQCRNRYNCLECGHKWNPDGAGRITHRPTCPECGAERLTHVDGWERDESLYEYWAIIDVIEGFQVVRMFRAEKYLKRKQPAQFHHQEVMQHVIREDGEIVSLSARCNGMGAYYLDQWIPGSDLEPRTPSYNHKMRCRISPYKIVPGRQTLPIIRRNGYKGYFKGEAPHLFFSTILKYPKAETLLKAGQYDLFKLCVDMEQEINERIEKYWDSICIAIRNDYVVEGAGMWLDYLGMLERFDKDLHNAHYVCPDDLKEAHDRYNRKINEIRARERLEKKRQKIAEENPHYVEAKGHFFDLRITEGDLEVVPLKSVHEFLVEGEELNHCLFNSDYHKREDSLILSARIDGERTETVEVDLAKMEVAQARGMQNQATEHHERIVRAVRQNMDKIAQRTRRREVAA